VTDPASLLVALVHARRVGDHSAEAEALTRLARRGFRIIFGDTLPPPRTRTRLAPAADANPSRAGR